MQYILEHLVLVPNIRLANAGTVLGALQRSVAGHPNLLELVDHKTKAQAANNAKQYLG